MRHIDKSQEPESLKVFKRGNPTNWDDIHSSENQHVYDDCLRQSISDQKGVCGYTEMLLGSSRHIDHYIRKGIDQSMTFEWMDMVAAVKDSRFGADHKDAMVKMADYDFAGKRYHCLYNPVADLLQNVFVYYSDGSIEPSDSADLKAVKTIEVFNLNEKSLKQIRKHVIQSVRTMKIGGLSRQDVYEYLKGEGFISCLAYEIAQSYK